MQGKLKKKFWIALVIFSLMGQVAWVVENMYFNVFIYKIFKASAAEISLMVGASAVMATVTTLVIGAFSDKVGKRKIFISGGYIFWGISIMAFCLLKMEYLTALTGSVVSAAALGVNLVILLDCVMTFFGSCANDACFNAWLTESGDDSNRGAIEGINAMMPLVSILAVFGGFMAFDLDKESSWTWIFLIIGISVLVIGVLGLFLIEEKGVKREENSKYLANLLYSFKPAVVKEHLLLYLTVVAFAVFCISINVFMPYLILYYEVSLQMTDYVLVMAPAIILAAMVTFVVGKLYDQLGFRRCVFSCVWVLMFGYVLLYFCKSTGLVFAGSLCMMSGYLAGMAVFGARIKGLIPEEKAGLFQGIRIFGQVFVPGIVGPAVGAFVLRGAEKIVNSDGTESFLPNTNIFAAAFGVAVVLLIVLKLYFRMIRREHRNLSTDFGDENSSVPFSEYPRPQLRRDSFYSLNGQWEEGLKVPYPPQSVLSGYEGKTGSYGSEKHMTFTRKFTLPEGFMKDRLLIHFGAVDQAAQVYLNGKLVGSHEDGYLAFTFDVTDAYKEGENLLQVKVTDALSWDYPYGKQCRKRGEMWYTPISGIWQSVWLESVPEKYIKGIRITPDLSGVTLEADTESESWEVTVQTEKGAIRKSASGSSIRIDLKEEGVEPKLWTPDTPYLYNMTIKAGADEVTSYFALRRVSIEKVGKKNRICLNGKPIFLHAVLDQGYYSDGIYLPASEKGYEFDIKAMKELGLNCLRKHIKVEPECFYYYCDKLGMLVMQDMVNSGRYSFTRDTALPTIGLADKVPKGRTVSKKRRALWMAHMKGVLEQLYNHPCIVYYTIFNEGWGQFDSDTMYEEVKKIDSTRIFDTASGWFRTEKSDVESSHVYFRNEPLPETEKPHVLSEFGGYSRVLAEHSFSLYNQHGYGFCKDADELTNRIVESYEAMVLSSMGNGLCGSVYTQLSDVEDEVNGFYTYDRKVCKVNKERMQNLSKRIYEEFERVL
ncbi:MAG: MFS transporter [Lachnospiraceae bacterium]|nr:MFS transporter [Lachnospiraceae bacterium]